MEQEPPPTWASGEGILNERRFAALYCAAAAAACRARGDIAATSAHGMVSPTTLLHEAYLGMAAGQAVFPDRERFLGYAARVMRGLIIELHSQASCAIKRGGAFHMTQLPDEFADASSHDVELTRLSDALDEPAVHEPRLAQVVDLRYFCGYTFEEIAAQRGISTRTVQRDWEKARVLLFQHLAEHC